MLGTSRADVARSLRRELIAHRCYRRRNLPGRSSSSSSGFDTSCRLYGDGAMFSYSVAVQDAWAFHWHNISGRSTVYLLSLLPAEAYVG